MALMWVWSFKGMSWAGWPRSGRFGININPWQWAQNVRQMLQEAGSYCYLFIVMYMVGRYVKLTVSLMRAIIMDRLSFREAYSALFRWIIREIAAQTSSLVWALCFSPDLARKAFCSLHPLHPPLRIFLSAQERMGRCSCSFFSPWACSFVHCWNNFYLPRSVPGFSPKTIKTESIYLYICIWAAQKSSLLSLPICPSSCLLSLNRSVTRAVWDCIRES